jgi:hypothetical protein
MTDNPAFETARQLLREGDTARALETLIAHLEASNADPEALQTLRVLESGVNATRRQEQKGILSFQEAQREYSKANDAILTLLNDLAAGRKTSGTPPAATLRRYWPVALGLLALTVATWFLLRQFRRPTALPDKCPDYQPVGYKILLLPFQNLGDGKANPEARMQGLIRDLTGKNNMPTQVELLETARFEKTSPDNAAAAAAGTRCGADMVIWGQYEKIGDSIAIDVSYVFSRQPKWAARTGFQVFRGISALQAGHSEGFRGLEEAIFRLCAVMALREERPEVAAKWLNRIAKAEGRDTELRDIATRMQAMMEQREAQPKRPLQRLREKTQ